MVILTLPEWRAGIGLDFKEPRMDDQKNRYTFIANKYGGWSKVILRSMPYGSNIATRMKGPEPSGFFFDELTETEIDDRDYFLKPIQQLRRPGTKYHHYIGTCNPSHHGEDHWVFKTFMVEPLDPITKVWDPRFAVYYMPLSENVYWSEEEKAEYQRTLMIVASAVPRCSWVRFMIRPMLVMTASSCSRTLAIPVKLLDFLTSRSTRKSFCLLASGHQSAKNLPFCSGFIGPTPPISVPSLLKI